MAGTCLLPKDESSEESARAADSSAFVLLRAQAGGRGGDGAIMPDGTRVLNQRMVRELGLSADEIVVLHLSDEHPFAVVSFYEAFPDRADAEVKRYLSADPAY